jgi:hypothetical protein
MPNDVSTVNVLEMDFFIVVARVVLSHRTLACLASDAQTVSDWFSQKMRATPRAGSTTPGPRPSC